MIFTPAVLSLHSLPFTATTVQLTLIVEKGFNSQHCTRIGHSSQDALFPVTKHGIHFHPFSMFHPLSFLLSIPPVPQTHPPSPIRALCSPSANQMSPLPPPPHTPRSPNKGAPPHLAQRGLTISPKLPRTQRPRPFPPKDLLNGPICSPLNPCLCTTHPHAPPPPLRSCLPFPVSSSLRLLS